MQTFKNSFIILIHSKIITMNTQYLRITISILLIFWIQIGHTQYNKMDTIQDDQFTHYLENDVKVKTEIDHFLITYNDKGFGIKNLKENIEANLTFSNPNKTKGRITYYKDDEKIGKLKFNNGRLIRGKIKTKISFKNKNIFLKAKVNKKQLLHILKPDKEVGFYMKMMYSTEIPIHLSYKNYEQIIFMFLKQENVSAQFLLNDGTFLSEFNQSKNTTEGVLIEYEVKEDKIVYQVYNFIDKSMSPVIYANLTFAEMVSKVRKLSIKNSAPEQPNILTKTGRTISGFYNLSGFEMAAKIYLLDNYYFFYSATFGSVDLEIYGTYSIVDDKIFLHPNVEQMQPYILYANEDETTKATTFSISKTRLNEQDEIYISINNKWFSEPKSSKIEEPIAFDLPKNKNGELTFGVAYLNGEFAILKNTYHTENIGHANNFIISANPYARMRRQFSNMPLMLKGDAIINNSANEKITKRQDIDDKLQDSIIQFIDENSRYKSVISHENKTYFKKPLTTVSGEVKLQNIEGELIEVK